MEWETKLLNFTIEFQQNLWLNVRMSAFLMHVLTVALFNKLEPFLKRFQREMN